MVKKGLIVNGSCTFHAGVVGRQFIGKDHDVGTHARTDDRDAFVSKLLLNDSTDAT